MRAYDQSLWTVVGGVHFLTRKGREWAYIRGAGLCSPFYGGGSSGEALRRLVESGTYLTASENATIDLRGAGYVVDLEGFLYLSPKGQQAHEAGLAHEERLLAAIAEVHPIGTDGKTTSLVRTVGGDDEWAPNVRLTGDTGSMVAPDPYRETCVSVAASGELGTGDCRVTWQRDRNGTDAPLPL